jgi:hypothetical protein
VHVAVEDHLGALRAEEIGEIVRLFLRVHHEGEAAKQRPRIEPAQVIAEVDDLADNEQAGADRMLLDLIEQRAQRSRDGALRRERTLKDDSPRVRQAIGHVRSLGQHFRSCCGPAYDTIVPSSAASAVQSIFGFLAALVFVAAHERHGVAAAGYVIGMPEYAVAPIACGTPGTTS